MFRRRDHRKPPEHLYSAFKDHYAHLSDLSLNASPATPFPPGPPLPQPSCNSPSSSSANNPPLTSGLGDKPKDMSPRTYELSDLDAFETSHFLDPNHLDSTFGGGFAPSPSAFHAVSAGLTAGNPFTTASSADLSSSASYDQPSIAAPHHFFPYQQTLGSTHSVSNLDLAQSYSNYQHYPASQAFGAEANFNPQQSLIHNDVHSSLMPDSTFHNLSHPSVTYTPGQSLKQSSTAPLNFTQRQQQQFRWHLTLRAHTAMIKNEEEIPMTYLNKRQPYTIFISDSKPPLTGMAGLVQYRTSVRVCFDEEQQRARPAACWQLFREGRGHQENDARGGGTLQAVEYVQPEQSALGGLRGNVTLEKENFDGFTFNWWPTPTGSAECSVQLRFNFLSTDFSHSKGVKGVPVRLVAKTELISAAPGTHSDPSPERSFCKIKLFRDHGAERKLANDRQHLSKKIEKFQKQLGEDEMKDNGKRRRSAESSSRPSKVMKHSRTWSISSDGSDDFDNPAEGELRTQLRTMEAQFATQQDYSLFFLRGEEADDPDLYPIDVCDSFAAPIPTLQRSGTQNTTQSSNLSPTSSTRSGPSILRRDSGFRQPTPLNPQSSRKTSHHELTPVSRASSDHLLARPSNPQHLITPPDGVTTVKKILENGDGDHGKFIEVSDADPNYQPPPPRTDRPIACFYVKASLHGSISQQEHYRAIYLHQRTRKEFLCRLARKCGIKPSSIDEAVRVTSEGLHVILDDDLVAEMAEGQDMHADFDLADENPLSFTNDDELSPDHYKLKLRY